MSPRRLVLICCPLIAILLYLPTLGHDFVFDDRGVIVQNSMMYDIRDVPRVLVSPYWSREAGLYRPLTSLSFALDRFAARGMKPAWFHLVNTLLHGAATLLVTLLALELLPGVLPAAVSGLLFALHPVHVEAVAGVVGRAEILAACAVLLCLRWHRRAQRAPPGGNVARLMLAAWGFSFLAIMSKESAIVGPFLCVLADAAYPGDPAQPSGRRMRLYAGYAGVLAVAGLARLLVLGALGPGRLIPFVDNPAAAAGALEGRLTALGAVTRYAGLFLWPANLSADYSFDQIPVIDSFGDPLAIAGLALVVGTLGLGAWLLRRARVGGFALLFIVISIAPVSNLVFFIGTLLAERLMYLPSVGLCLLAGSALALPGRVARSRILVLVSLGLVALAAGRSWVRLSDWRDDFALYRSAAAVSPRSARIRYNLGNVHLRRGEHAEAETSYRRALSIYAEFNEARINLGMALLQQEKVREAASVLESAREHAPRHADLAVNLGSAYRALGDTVRAEAEFRRALELEPDSALAWNNLGGLDLARGDPGRAVENIRQAVLHAPDQVVYRINLADALMAAGRPQEAAVEFRKGYRLDPDLPDAHRGLGEVALQHGDRVTAESEFSLALELDPRAARAANFLGYLLALRGDARGAVEHYTRAVTIDPTLHDAHRSLGQIYAENLGDAERAVFHLETSLRLAPQQPDAERLRALLRELQR